MIWLQVDAHVWGPGAQIMGIPMGIMDKHTRFGYSDAYARGRGSWIIGIANCQSQSPPTGWMPFGGVMSDDVFSSDAATHFCPGMSRYQSEKSETAWIAFAFWKHSSFWISYVWF